MKFLIKIALKYQLSVKKTIKIIEKYKSPISVNNEHSKINYQEYKISFN